MAYDSESRTSLAMGATLVKDLLHFRPEKAMRIWASDGGYLERYHDEDVQRAIELGIPVFKAHEGIVINGRALNHSIVAEFEKWQDTLRPGSHVVLVEPANSSNVGAIMRTALGFGIRDFAIIKEGFDTFEPKVVRTSMGARLGMRAEVFSSFQDYQDRFPENNLYAFMLLDGAQGLSEVEKRAPFSLVFGNETVGLPAEFAETCQPVFIEQSEQVDSLNVAVSAALGIYAFTRACPPATEG